MRIGQPGAVQHGHGQDGTTGDGQRGPRGRAPRSVFGLFLQLLLKQLSGTRQSTCAARALEPGKRGRAVPDSAEGAVRVTACDFRAAGCRANSGE